MRNGTGRAVRAVAEWSRLLVLLTGVWWLAGCEQPRQPKARQEPEWVLGVGDSMLTPEDFRQEWERLVAQRQGGVLRDEVVSAMVSEWMAYEAARMSGFADTAEMQAEWRRLVGTRYRERQQGLKRAEMGPADLSEESIRAEYAMTEDRWERPETKLVGCFSRLLPAKASEEKREEVRAMVEGWRESVVTHQDPRARFAELCRLHSEDAVTRYFAGESGWLIRSQRRERWGDAAGDAVDALGGLGEVTPVIEVAGRLCVFQLRGVRERTVRPLGEVAGRLRAERVQRWEEMVDRAVAGELALRVVVKTNQAVLGRVEPPVEVNPAGAPPPKMMED